MKYDKKAMLIQRWETIYILTNISKGTAFLPQRQRLCLLKYWLKYIYSFPTVESALLFYRIWFFNFLLIRSFQLQDPVLLFCYGGPCKVYCFGMSR